jgi:signal transduction histidine kinase
MNVKSASVFLRSTTVRLASTYLLIIMVLSIGFSVVLYQTSYSEIGRQAPPPSFYENELRRDYDGPNYHEYFRNRIEESRDALLGSLILLNLVALTFGAGLSYYLARRTLIPIEEAMESQNRFVTDASHELRTPLTAILTSNEVALRKPKLTLPQAKEVIKSNTEEIIKLKDLTDGLLTLSKQGNGNDSNKAFSLQTVSGDAMNQLLPTAQAKNISIDDKVPNIQVRGNQQSLAQVLVILLDNAIKYSSENKTIYVSGSKKNKTAYLSVRDEGQGISPEDLPHIFERFYRADQSRTKSETNGYGIGLSIAKKIIEQHGGKISVASTPKVGTTFSIELPLA